MFEFVLRIITILITLFSWSNSSRSSLSLGLQIFLGFFSNLSGSLRDFPAFAVTHFIADSVELGYHVEEVEDDLDMRGLAL